ncbi:hypothetical protein [Bizionia sp.]|uniref:hypothetical protein n=1 Tax=Bizionia sp. TaxID=1954480 RepID=UPI003A8F58FD
MVFLKVENWRLLGFLVVIHGEEAVMIRFRKRMIYKIEVEKEIVIQNAMMNLHKLYAVRKGDSSVISPSERQTKLKITFHYKLLLSYPFPIAYIYAHKR